MPPHGANAAAADCGLRNGSSGEQGGGHLGAAPQKNESTCRPPPAALRPLPGTQRAWHPRSGRRCFLLFCTSVRLSLDTSLQVKGP